MALNRYLYPQKGTNIVQQVTLSTRVSVDGATGNVTGIVSGRGMTVTHAGLGVYNVVLDNSSTVSAVVCAKAGYICAYDKTKKIAFHVTGVTTGGCTLQSYQVDNGNDGAVDVTGSLWVELTCSLSSVPA